MWGGSGVVGDTPIYGTRAQVDDQKLSVVATTRRGLNVPMATALSTRPAGKVDNTDSLLMFTNRCFAELRVLPPNKWFTSNFPEYVRVTYLLYFRGPKPYIQRAIKSPAPVFLCRLASELTGREGWAAFIRKHESDALAWTMPRRWYTGGYKPQATCKRQYRFRYWTHTAKTGNND